jgi:RNA polymerase sigma-70 factor, ECF subfamily
LRQGLADLWRTESALLLRLAHGILRDRHAAEDACQQALLRACEPQAGVPEPTRLRAWLARVVVNESLAVLRRRKVEQRFRTEQLAAGEPGGAPTSEASLWDRETVLAALVELPEANRLVVLLRIMQGMSGNAVSAMLGCSAAEVSRRLYLGMEQLRERLAHAEAGALKDHSHGS